MHVALATLRTRLRSAQLRAQLRCLDLVYYSFRTRAGASERGGLSRGLAQADPGPGVLGPEPCLGRLRAVGVFDDSR